MAGSPTRLHLAGSPVFFPTPITEKRRTLESLDCGIEPGFVRILFVQRVQRARQRGTLMIYEKCRERALIQLAATASKSARESLAALE